MFNIGIGEILFIAILALIFIGPERLPKVMRQVGGYVYQARQIMNEITGQFSDELGPIQEIQGLANDLNPMKQLGGIMDPAQPADPIPAPSIAPPTLDTPPLQPSNPMAEISKAMSVQTAANAAVQPEPAPSSPMSQIGQAMERSQADTPATEPETPPIPSSDQAKSDAIP